MRSARLCSARILAAMLTVSFVGCDPDGDGHGSDAGEDGGTAFGTNEPGTVLPGDPCNGTIDCTPGSICYSNICVQDGALRFSLSWDVDTDFDLHVLTPAGSEISFEMDEADFGVLDVDDCTTLAGCRLPDHKHVENVFFTDEASSGEYSFWVRNYDGDTAGAFTLVVARDGNAQDTHVGNLPPETTDSERFTYTY